MTDLGCYRADSGSKHEEVERMKSAGDVEKRPESEVRAAWEKAAWHLLKEEMRKRKIDYKELSRRLETHGIRESADRLNRKVNRRRFPAAFLLACLAALDVKRVDVPADPFDTP